MARRPSPPHPSTRRSAPPPNYLPWAVLTTVCFLPIGLLALRHATRVERLWFSGRDDDARRSSQSAHDLVLAAAFGAIALSALAVVTLAAVSLSSGTAPTA